MVFLMIEYIPNLIFVFPNSKKKQSAIHQSGTEETVFELLNQKSNIYLVFGLIQKKKALRERNSSQECGCKSHTYTVSSSPI